MTVEIFGERYTIRGDAEEGHISEVAKLVDGRIRELSESCGPIGKSRLAILTAINLADELLQIKSSRRSDTDEEEELLRRTRQLILLLDEGLTGDVMKA